MMRHHSKYRELSQSNITIITGSRIGNYHKAILQLLQAFVAVLKNNQYYSTVLILLRRKGNVTVGKVDYCGI